jgi:heterodisulfide reductase subunit A-like polyferredoxin
MEGGIPPIPEGYGHPAASVMNSFTQVLVIGGGLIGSTAVTFLSCEGFGVMLVIPLRIPSLAIKVFKDRAVVI